MEMPIVWFVSQISMPVRILLIGAAVFLAAWFTLLRPKSETVPPLTTSTTTTPVATSTPQTGLGKAVDAAKKAAGVKPQATAAAKTESATTTTPEVKPANAAIADVPAEVLAKLPKAVVSALEDRKVLVLGVLSEDAKPWRPLADDDRYVRNALKRTNRYDGDVVVRNVALDKLSTLGPLVNDLGVTQSPSIVVIDRDLKGTVLTGYVDRVSINQAIADARRASTMPNITDTYLREVNSTCAHFDTRIERWSLPTIPGKKARVAATKRRLAIQSAYVRRYSKIPAPAKWGGLKRQFLTYLRADQRATAAMVTAVKSGTNTDIAKAASMFGALTKPSRSLDRRFNAVGLTEWARTRTS
jgi:hypothetical protein